MRWSLGSKVIKLGGSLGSKVIHLGFQHHIRTTDTSLLYQQNQQKKIASVPRAYSYTLYLSTYVCISFSLSLPISPCPYLFPSLSLSFSSSPLLPFLFLSFSPCLFISFPFLSPLSFSFSHPLSLSLSPLNLSHIFSLY